MSWNSEGLGSDHFDEDSGQENEDNDIFYDANQYLDSTSEQRFRTDSGYLEGREHISEVIIGGIIKKIEERSGGPDPNHIRPYAEPILQSEDSRRFVSGRPSVTGAYQRTRQLFGFPEDPAPYGRDAYGNALSGAAPYEEHYPTFDSLNLSAGWTLGKEQLEQRGYKIDSPIGSGAFAEVLKVSYEGRPLACKVMEIRRFKGRKNLKTAVQQMTTEINVLRGLSHPHILCFDDVIFIPDTQSGFPKLFVFIMMQLMEGDLMGLINSWKRFSVEDAHQWFTQISSGLYYLHENNVSHLDIKPENILYHRIEKDFIFKLGDFGIAKSFGVGEPSLTKDRWGTPLFKAPELCGSKFKIRGMDYFWPQEFDTKACDVYSLGVTLGLTLIGRLMSSKITAHQWITDNLINKMGYDMSDPLIELLFQMTELDPMRRCRMSDVINHYWIKSLNK